MANSDVDLRERVRRFGNYDKSQLSNSDIDGLIGDAKTHLKAAIPRDIQPDWYQDGTHEEALFWTTMLFSKVQTGALDAKAISAGGLDEDQLLAKADDDTTTWYREYEKARERLVAAERGNTSYSSRSNRTSSGGSRTYRRDN